jgi:multisubunit Na+/H+ antiporter MnhE subunit
VSGPAGSQPARPRRQEQRIPLARRVRAWLAWWVVLMGFWVAVDDSIGLAEVGAGAGAAALGALVAELAGHQAATRFRPRPQSPASAVSEAVKLPGQVARDTVIVFAALWRRLLTGEQPASGFRELPVRPGDAGNEDVTRRVLLVGANSLAPNTFVLGIDADRDVMVVHQLVVNQGRAAQ